MRQEINLIQGSQEWLDFRRVNYKTASRTPIVIGLSPFLTKEDLAKEIKFGITKGTNYAMQQGIDREDDVRFEAEKIFSDSFMPKVYQNGEYVASLDGINFAGDAIIECKVSEKTYNAIKIHNWHEYRHYEWQVIHQLYVSGSKKGYLVAMNPKTDEIEYSEITYKESYFTEIQKAWDDFDKFLETYELPSEETIEDVVAIGYAEQYALISEQIKLLEAQQKEYKSKLESYATADKTIIGKLTISKTKGRKTTDWEQLVLDNGLSVDEKYIKVGKDGYTIRINK